MTNRVDYGIIALMKYKRPNEEKVERNDKIFCEKEGLESPEDYRLVKAGQKKAGKKMSYRELMIKYNLSATTLLRIIQRLRQRYE